MDSSHKSFVPSRLVTNTSQHRTLYRRGRSRLPSLRSNPSRREPAVAGSARAPCRHVGAPACRFSAGSSRAPMPVSSDLARVAKYQGERATSTLLFIRAARHRSVTSRFVSGPRTNYRCICALTRKTLSWKRKAWLQTAVIFICAGSFWQLARFVRTGPY